MIGKDFLTFAKTIHSHKDEAARRSSVSRAYFALFHHIKSIVDSVVPPRPRRKQGAEEHIKYVRYLKESKIEDAIYVGGKLEDLREERNDADYDLKSIKFDERTCAFHCLMAESLCRDIDKINKTTELKKRFTIYAKVLGELKR